MKVEFCTCDSYDCPNHPRNHDQGCTPCILKNLKLREIPSCFFNMADPDGEREGYFFEDFAKAVMKYGGSNRSQRSRMKTRL